MERTWGSNINQFGYVGGPTEVTLCSRGPEVQIEVNSVFFFIDGSWKRIKLVLWGSGGHEAPTFGSRGPKNQFRSEWFFVVYAARKRPE